MRASPQHSTASGGLGQVGLEPGQPTLRDGGTADVRDGELVPGLHPRQVARQRGGAVVRRVEERERALRVGDRVQVGEHLDRRVLEPALVLATRVEEPVVAEVVGQHVARDEPVDAVHQEERSAEDVTRGLHPPDLRDGDVGGLPHDPDRVVLVLEGVLLEDRKVLGCRCHPGDVLPGSLRPGLGPGDVERHGLGRETVLLHRAVQHDRRSCSVGKDGEQPLGEPRADSLRVPAGALHRHVGGWGWLGHAPA